MEININEHEQLMLITAINFYRNNLGTNASWLRDELFILRKKIVGEESGPIQHEEPTPSGRGT